ncbi:gastrin/cholecystokinin-like peptide [Sparus aurata]|uniref:Gastrin/cholecystokinin-like peptide n=2 Tax=Sparus aurata TaxID=8175 RepID=A0A671TU77_SPAAU|nr:gastrin/cholecystokinin-like peptide [Sparus aurata]
MTGSWMSAVSSTHILPMHPFTNQSLLSVFDFSSCCSQPRCGIKEPHSSVCTRSISLVGFCCGHLLLHTDMSGKVFVVITLLVALLVSSAASSPVEAKETTMLQQLLDKREKVKDLGGRQDRAPPAFAARVERRAHLSEDEREIMTKQIMQAISEMMNTECMSDRDYQGWVDFGRRDAE